MIAEMMQAVSEIQPEPEMILTVIDCPDCVDETVEIETRSQNFFNPFGVELGTCSTCHGSREIEVEICSACGKQEFECRCLDIVEVKAVA